MTCRTTTTMGVTAKSSPNAKELRNPKVIRSSFGSQPLSVHPSASSFGFGSSSRGAFVRQYLSPEHAQAMGGDNSPGAIYNMLSSISKQPLSNNSNSAKFSFGTAERIGKKGNKADRKGMMKPGPGAYKMPSSIAAQIVSTKKSAATPSFGSSTRDNQQKLFLTTDHEKIHYGRHSPGPSIYQATSCFGIQQNARNRSSPMWRMSKSSRFEYDYEKRASKLPGAGQYVAGSSVGKMVVSQKKTMPKFSFGRGTRDAKAKLFTSADHEKSQYGKHSPGPTTSVTDSSMGRQILSRRSSHNAWSFGSAVRKTFKESEVPGPGAYD